MNGDNDETIPNDPGSTEITGTRSFEAKDILDRAFNRSTEVDQSIRRVRRGKFFMSDVVQSEHGSMRRPIFQYYYHGVVVGETKDDPEREGQWCYGAHNDFDLIPELTPLGDWPEYQRTPHGFVRIDGPRRLEGTVSNAPPNALKVDLDEFIKKTSEIKRLK